MEIEIHSEPLELVIHGFGGKAANKDYAALAFRLSQDVWQIIKPKKIINRGKNVWVYEAADQVFAGVELESHSQGNSFGLVQKTILMIKYGCYNHVGPYNLIKRAGQNMAEELILQQQEIILPYIEIYGNWESDETKLETELFMALK